MANHTYYTVDRDGNPVALTYLVEVRHGNKRFREVVNKHDIAQAASHVCWYCNNFIEKREQPTHDCMGDDRGFQPTSPHAPI